MEILSTVLLMAPPGGNQPSFLVQMLPFIMVFGILYFMLIRPQQQEQKKRVEMLEAIKKGDRVVTTGGIIGRVDHLKGKDVVVIQVASGVKMEFRKSAIGEIIVKDEEEKS